MTKVSQYLHENKWQLLFALFLLTMFAFWPDPIGAAGTLAGGAMLQTQPMDDVLKKALQEHGALFKSFTERFEKSVESMSEKMSEHGGRLLDLEQRLAHKPAGGGGGGTSLAEALESALDKSEQFKALRGGRVKGSVVIPLDGVNLHQKAISSTISGGYISQADRSAVIVTPSARRLTVRDLLPSVSTSHGSTEFLRELSFSNNAGPQYDTSSPTPGQEGAVKNASDMTFEVVTSPITTVAHHFTVARQALDDSAALLQHIQGRGVYGLKLEEEDELVNGSGTSGELTGLLTAATAFSGGATNQSRADTLRKAITQLAIADQECTGILLNPRDVEGIELTKATTGEYLSIMVFVNGVPVLWRVPVISTNSIAAGSFLAGDFTMAATIRDRQEATVEISLDHADYRTRNLALILIEERIGLEMHRPTALVTGSLTYTG
jgi:HK97 family phage major capsid protein